MCYTPDNWEYEAKESSNHYIKLRKQIFEAKANLYKSFMCSGVTYEKNGNAGCGGFKSCKDCEQWIIYHRVLDIFNHLIKEKGV